MVALLQIITGTPYWVWLLLLYLIFVGIDALKDSVLSLSRLAIMPLIFLLWSLFSLLGKAWIVLGVYPVAWAVGSGLGYLFMHKLAIKVDRTTRLIFIPGTAVTLLLSLGFFLLKYILGATYALHPLMKENLYVVSFDAALSGLFAGFSFGRFLKIVQEYRRS